MVNYHSFREVRVYTFVANDYELEVIKHHYAVPRDRITIKPDISCNDALRSSLCQNLKSAWTGWSTETGEDLNSFVER